MDFRKFDDFDDLEVDIYQNEGLRTRKSGLKGIGVVKEMLSRGNAMIYSSQEDMGSRSSGERLTTSVGGSRTREKKTGERVPQKPRTQGIPIWKRRPYSTTVQKERKVAETRTQQLRQQHKQQQQQQKQQHELQEQQYMPQHSRLPCGCRSKSSCTCRKKEERSKSRSSSRREMTTSRLLSSPKSEFEELERRFCKEDYITSPRNVDTDLGDREKFTSGDTYFVNNNNEISKSVSKDKSPTPKVRKPRSSPLDAVKRATNLLQPSMVRYRRESRVVIHEVLEKSKSAKSSSEREEIYNSALENYFKSRSSVHTKDTSKYSETCSSTGSQRPMSRTSEESHSPDRSSVSSKSDRTSRLNQSSSPDRLSISSKSDHPTRLNQITSPDRLSMSSKSDRTSRINQSSHVTLDKDETGFSIKNKTSTDGRVQRMELLTIDEDEQPQTYTPKKVVPENIPPVVELSDPGICLGIDAPKLTAAERIKRNNPLHQDFSPVIAELKKRNNPDTLKTEILGGPNRVVSESTILNKDDKEIKEILRKSKKQDDDDTSEDKSTEEILGTKSKLKTDTVNDKYKTKSDKNKARVSQGISESDDHTTEDELTSYILSCPQLVKSQRVSEIEERGELCSDIVKKSLARERKNQDAGRNFGRHSKRKPDELIHLPLKPVQMNRVFPSPGPLPYPSYIAQPIFDYPTIPTDNDNRNQMETEIDFKTLNDPLNIQAVLSRYYS